MTISQLLQRARSQVGRGIRYRLGGGKLFPEGDNCAGEDNTCDCSGFVDWCLGLPRQFDHPFHHEVNGGWINTDAIWRDARHGHILFEECPPSSGGLIVYPCGKMAGSEAPAVGHVGIITAVEEARVVKVIHCSESNMQIDGQAIHETDAQIFIEQETTICCWCKRIAREEG